MRYLKIFPLLFCLLSLPLHAVESRGLYKAEVEVPDQGAGARSEGMRQAMASVLVKVSGAGRVQDDASLAEAMKQPERYVQQYRYRTDATASQRGNRLLLDVSFDQRSIDDLLRQSGFSVWGDARPTTLIWLGVEDGGNRVLVGDKDRGMVRQLIDGEAERRALPVKLPRLDATDRGKVRTADVWGEFLDTIKGASQRYAAQAILVGRLYPVSSRRWEARWVLDYNGELSHWRSDSGDVASLLAEAIDRVTDNLASHFAQSLVNGSGEMRMRVEGVRNLKDYRRVIDYLSGVHGVKQVVAETMTSSEVLLRITSGGGSDAVLQVIALGNTLAKVKQPVNETLRLNQVPMQDERDKGVISPSNSDAPMGAARMTKVVEPPKPELVYRLIP